MAVCSHLTAGDLAPLLSACGATITTVALVGGEVHTPFESWRGAANRANAEGCVVLHLNVPLHTADGEARGLECEFVCALKAAPRRTGAIGTVAAGLILRLKADAGEGAEWTISGATLHFAGLRPERRGALLVARRAEAAFERGESFTAVQDDFFAAVADSLRADIAAAAEGVPVSPQRSKYQPPALAPKEEELHEALAVSLLFRFYVACAEFLELLSTTVEGVLPPPPLIDPRDRSATAALRDAGAADRLGAGADLFGTGATISRGAQAWTRTEGYIQTAMGEKRNEHGVVIAADLSAGSAAAVGPHTDVELPSPSAEVLEHDTAYSRRALTRAPVRRRTAALRKPFDSSTSLTRPLSFAPSFFSRSESR